MQTLLVSELISSVGSLMSVVALPWFVLETTGSPGKMGIVLAAEAAPLALLFVASGRVAARLGPRRALLLCDFVWALTIGAIPTLHSAGALSFGLLLALSFVAGVPWAAHYGSQDALVAELGATQIGIAQAKAVFQTVARLAYFLGPVLGGILLAASSASVVLAVDAISFAISFAIVATFVRDKGQAVADDRVPAIAGGLAFIRRDPTLRVITGSQMLSQAAFMAMTAAIPALAFTAYEQDAELAGTLLGAWGAGAMLGGVIAFRLVGSYDPLRLGAAAWLLQAVPLWAMVASPAPAWVVAALSLSGLGNGIRVPPIAGVATELIPKALRPETLTVSSALVLGAGFAGLLLTAPAISTVGATAVFGALAAVQSVAAALIVWLTRQRPARATRAAAQRMA
jgi:MFS family permease